MTTAVQRRRGTNTEHASFTGLEGEISVNTTNESVHVHDGSTAGGFELMRADGANSTVTLGDISGVTAGTGLSGGGTTGTVTLDIDGTVATLAGTQTFTNKTLTSPILNTPTIGTSFTIGGATITETELEILDGATVTTTELNYVDGVTSAIQTQIDAKAPLASPSFTGTATMDGLTVDGLAQISAQTNGTYALRVGDATGSSGSVVGIGKIGINPQGAGTFTYTGTEIRATENAIGDYRAALSFHTRGTTSDAEPLKRLDIANSGDISFYEDTGTTPKLFWDASAESLGIGTSSPSETLAVESSSNNAILLNSPANRYNAVGFQSAGVDKWWMGRADTDIIAGDAFFIGADAGNATDAGGTNAKLVIGSSGNVGIGTSSPSEELEIASSSPTIKLTDTDDSTSGKVSYNVGALFLIGDQTIRFNTSDTERMRILSTGGITFNGDTAQANALDDYEEGTWTPTVLFSSQSVGVVYTQQVGIYTKIGDLVTLFAEIRLSSKGSSTGSLQIGGLPFTPSLGAVNWVGGTTANFAFFSSLNSPPLPSVNNNQARITMRQLNNSSGLGTSDPLLTNSNVSNSMILGVTVTYKV